MSGNNSGSDILNFILSLFFALWPLYLIAPLNWRRNALTGLVAIWAFLAIVRTLLFLSSFPILAIVIPEPLNTIIFFVVGGILILLKVGKDILQRLKIRQKAESARNIEDLRSLSPKEFEEMVVELYVAMGHKAKRTGTTGDHGIDVVVQATNGEKWVVQCKRWRGTVGEPVVRDFYGVMHHEKADKGAIITTGKFTPQAREWARGKPLTLLEGDEFLAYLRKTHNFGKQPTISEEKNTSPRCPRCGSEMVLRTAKTGPNQGEKFWGCSNYPRCRGIVKYEVQTKVAQ